MVSKKLLPGWEYLGGKAQRYRNITTGEEISRRKYDEKIRGAISYEAKAAHNKKINPELSLVRPARGRKSHLKSADWVKKEIAQHRVEAAKAKEEKKKKAKEEKELHKRNVQLSKKRVRVKKVRKHLIPRNQIGWRISFNNFDELETLLSDAKDTGVIFAYGLGFVGVDTRIGQLRAVTVFRLRSIGTDIDEGEFSEEMEAALQEYSYIIPAHFFVHFAIDKKFVGARAR